MIMSFSLYAYGPGPEANHMKATAPSIYISIVERAIESHGSENESILYLEINTQCFAYLTILGKLDGFPERYMEAIEAISNNCDAGKSLFMSDAEVAFELPIDWSLALYEMNTIITMK